MPSPCARKSGSNASCLLALAEGLSKMRYCLAACLCFVLALVPPASAETLRAVDAGNLTSAGKQAVSKARGFDLAAQVEPAQSQRGLLVQRAGQSSQVVSSE